MNENESKRCHSFTHRAHLNLRWVSSSTSRFCIIFSNFNSICAGFCRIIGEFCKRRIEVCQTFLDLLSHPGHGVNPFCMSEKSLPVDYERKSLQVPCFLLVLLDYKMSTIVAWLFLTFWRHARRNAECHSTILATASQNCKKKENLHTSALHLSIGQKECPSMSSKKISRMSSHMPECYLTARASGVSQCSTIADTCHLRSCMRFQHTYFVLG